MAFRIADLDGHLRVPLGDYFKQIINESSNAVRAVSVVEAKNIYNWVDLSEPSYDRTIANLWVSDNDELYGPHSPRTDAREWILS